MAHQGSIAASKLQASVRPRSATAKGRIKSSTIAVYSSVFVLLIVLIAIGYRSPEQVSGVANAAPLVSSGAQQESDKKKVNDVVASTIAANVATATNLSVAPSVTSLAISTQIQSELPTTDDSSISKPQIIQVSSASRKITSYQIVAGDTVDSIAAKFGITRETLKWANNLVSDNLTLGSNIDILPRSGIAYTVKAGDTIASIAAKYKSDPSAITTYNDLEIAGLSTGLKIVIPNGELPNNERPGYSPPVQVVTYGYSAGFSGTTFRIKIGTPMYAGNTYYTGNCTAYAFDRRVELGLPISASWGNATTWDNGARAAGLSVSNRPSVGAIMQNEGGYGHVAIVEKLLPNGDIEISEMNASVAGGGWNVVNGRTVSASAVGQYAYIR